MCVWGRGHRWGVCAVSSYLLTTYWLSLYIYRVYLLCARRRCPKAARFSSVPVLLSVCVCLSWRSRGTRALHMVVLALHNLLALAAAGPAPPTFELVGYPKECNCLEAKDPARQLRLETYLTVKPGAPLLQANHDNGERFLLQASRRRTHLSACATPVYARSQPLHAEHGGALRQRTGCACTAEGRSRAVTR